jgi:hypothetical protein
MAVNQLRVKHDHITSFSLMVLESWTACACKMLNKIFLKKNSEPCHENYGLSNFDYIYQAEETQILFSHFLRIPLFFWEYNGKELPISYKNCENCENW